MRDSLSSFLSRAGLAVALSSFSVPALAQDVLLVHADFDDCAADVQTGFQAIGYFTTVDVFDAKLATPTLAQLQQYDAVMTWSNDMYSNPVLLGDAFADYVDGGGGVVVALATSASAAIMNSLGGRWASEGYPIIPTNGFAGLTGNHFLGSVLEPDHPILAGVLTLDGGSISLRPIDQSVSSGATRLAEWDDGSTLVAVGGPTRVDLGLWPGGSNGCGSANGWDSGTDGMELMANSLAFVSGGVGKLLGQNYCGPANFNSSGLSAEILAFGSDEVSFDLVTLTAEQLPANQFGYFLNSMTQGFSPFPPGSQGNLCLGGGIGRYAKQVKNSGALGVIELDLDLTNTPTPGGLVSILVGETWNFQAWFRDANPVPTSNFTDGVSITFL